jgi:plasmid stabilization system protein ParE
VCIHPESGFLTPFGETRMIAMGNHSIYYLFDDERIVVMAFWDNRQDPDKLLMLLTSS